MNLKLKTAKLKLLTSFKCVGLRQTTDELFITGWYEVYKVSPQKVDREAAFVFFVDIELCIIAFKELFMKITRCNLKKSQLSSRVASWLRLVSAKRREFYASLS